MAQLNESHSKIKQPPRTADVATLREYVANLANILAKLAKDLDYIINGNLDVKNIRANSITADRLDVDELSAISANLGEITAGIIRGIEIYGSLIATNETGYPRTELSVIDNYFKVWLSETTFVEIIDMGEEGFPQITFVRGSQRFKLGHGIHEMPGVSNPGLFANTPFTIYAVPEVQILSRTEFVNWNNIVNQNTGMTLQQELNDIRSTISALQTQVNGKADKGTSTLSAGSANGGIAPGTQLAVNGGGYVTWLGIPSHSHTQN